MITRILLLGFSTMLLLLTAPADAASANPCGEVRYAAHPQEEAHRVDDPTPPPGNPLAPKPPDPDCGLAARTGSWAAAIVATLGALATLAIRFILGGWSAPRSWPEPVTQPRPHATPNANARSGRYKIVTENQAGRFGDMNPGVPGDGLTPHHIPQNGLRFLLRDDGGAIVMKQADHALTRNYGYRGRATKAAEAGLPFRTVLARDIWDMRRIGQQQYGDPGYYNKGIQGLLAYYRSIGFL